MKNKYSECYVKEIDNNLSIDKLDRFCDGTNHLTKYINSLYCPECKKAKLTYTGKTYRACSYLSRIPSSKHRENCSYNFDVINNKIYKRKLQEFKPEKAQSMLNTAINLLKPNGIELNEDNDLIIYDNKKTSNHLGSRIAYQAYRENFSRVEYNPNKLCLYYGKVKMKIVEKEDKNDNKKIYKFIYIYVNNKGKGSFLPYIDFDYNMIDENKYYYLAFFATMKKNDWKYLNYYILDNSKKYFYIEECK